MRENWKALVNSAFSSNAPVKGWRVSTVLIRTIGFAVVGVFVSASSLALADEVPEEFLGTWSTLCGDTNTPRIDMAANSIAITVGGTTHRYNGINASRTWYGGAKADGNRIWLPTSKRPGQKFAFVAAPPPFGTGGPMILEEGVPEASGDIRSIFGASFRRCELGLPPSVQVLDVPFSDKGGDGQASWCAVAPSPAWTRMATASSPSVRARERSTESSTNSTTGTLSPLVTHGVHGSR